MDEKLSFSRKQRIKIECPECKKKLTVLAEKLIIYTKIACKNCNTIIEIQHESSKAGSCGDYSLEKAVGK